MRLNTCFVAVSLLSPTVANAEIARAATPHTRAAAITLRPSLRLDAVDVAPLWGQSGQNDLVLRVTNKASAARRCVVRLRARNEAGRVAWKLRYVFTAPRGASMRRLSLTGKWALGPYEIAAMVDQAASAATAKTQPPFAADISAAFAVVPELRKSALDAGPSLAALLGNGRARDVPSWLRASGLPLAAPSPEGDARFADERDRRMERKLRREARIESIFIAHDNLRYDGFGDARFMDETAARGAWSRGEAQSLPLLVDWPADTTLPEAAREDFATSAQAMRGLIAARHLGTTTDFAVGLPRDTAAGASADDVLTRTATSFAAGASRVLLPFDETAPFDRTAARHMASMASWNAMTEGARFDGMLFGASPLLRSAVFTSGHEHTALVWLERNGNSAARLVTKLDGAVYDQWGNALKLRPGVCVLPLGNGPVWVRSSDRDWKRAWQGASLENTRLLAAQVLPLHRDPRGGVKTLDVRLQNTGISPQGGVLSVSAPGGWSMAEDEANYRLAPGEAKTFRFAVGVARANAKNEYPIGVAAKHGTGRWTWKQTARVATATETAKAPLIDAELSEWKGASWMRVGKAPLTARVALSWDATRLYVAAVVHQPAPKADATAADFWKRDAIQLAFGMRDEPGARPQSAPFRDTDYGFILLPWREGEARLLRAWNPATPFDGWNGRLRDRDRWGGAVPGAHVATRRDERHGLTLYEASLPLSEMPKLRPVQRASDDLAVRFAFQLHSGTAPALSWSRANNVFAWWGNPVSFMGGIAPAAQVPLGFTSIPPRELQELPPAAPPRPKVDPTKIKITAPPPITDPEAQRAPETGAPRRRRRPSPPREAPVPPDDFKPPVLEPMSPSTLPPAQDPPGKPIPPAPTAKE